MLPKKRDDRTILACTRCGFEEEAEDDKGYRLVKQIRHGPRDAIVVLEGNVKVETLPKTKALCPRCGYGEAYYWEMQTRSADEPATRFFRCVKCGYVWREYQ